jgi:thiosulfate/3-mercaptopyruvate sulfurtransferase
MANYARPDVLVSTQWALEHLNDPNVRFVEVDVDTSAYEEGHIPGAVGWNWQKDLCDMTRRDIVSKEAFEELCSRSGISNDTIVVLYGDNNNWFAAWAFWQFRIYGHDEDKLKLLNGGRKKWIEEGLPLTKEVPQYPRTNYKAKDPDFSIRAFFDEVVKVIQTGEAKLVDVRSPQEYVGELLAPPGLPEGVPVRGGHIPGAVNIPWSQDRERGWDFQELRGTSPTLRKQGHNA